MTRQKRIPERILVVASMNAGAEAVSPVAEKLREKGAKVKILSYRAATSSFKAMGVKPDRILEKDSYVRDAIKELSAFQPTSVLTGTQIQDEEHPLTLEQVLWRTSAGINIESVAILDTWGNYVERFSDLKPLPGGNKLTIKKGTELKYLPDKIAIIDEFAKKEMLALGFPEAVLEITGSPYFEHVLTEAEKLAPETRAQLLSKPVFSEFDKDGKLIVFMSDDIEGFYPDIGFTEKSVLQSFLKVMDEITAAAGAKLNVIVRPHPFRNENAREAYECETSNIAKVFHNPITARGEDSDNEYSMEELLHSADLVVGTFNNPLITAKLMGKTVLSYQPGLNEKYNFQHYLHEQDLVTKITEEGKLGGTVLDLLSGDVIQKTMEAAKGATDRIIRLLD